jgi:hypothetical protein
MTASQETWSKRIKQWRVSGLGVKEFAASIGVNPHQLHYWTRRLERENAPLAGTSCPPTEALPTEPLQFVELVNVTAPPAGPPPCIELVAPSGMTIRVPQAFDPDTLRRVLSIIKENP